jgi:hypothetical protein
MSHPVHGSWHQLRLRDRLRGLLRNFDPTQRPSSNVFRIQVRFELPSGKTRSGVLLLDTGSDFNIVGLQLAELLDLNLDHDRAERLANTAGGYMNTLGETTLRWYYSDGRSRFESSVFQVSAKRLDVDAIIGWQSLLELDLVMLSTGYFVGFTSRASRVNGM